METNADYAGTKIKPGKRGKVAAGSTSHELQKHNERKRRGLITLCRECHGKQHGIKRMMNAEPIILGIIAEVMAVFVFHMMNKP